MGFLFRLCRTSWYRRSLNDEDDDETGPDPGAGTAAAEDAPVAWWWCGAFELRMGGARGPESEGVVDSAGVHDLDVDWSEGSGYWPGG